MLRVPRLLPTITCLLAAVCVAGCQSTPKAGLSAAIEDYQTCDYDAAYAEAMAVIRESSGETRCSAAWIAGLSAWKLGNEDEARRRWTMALESHDEATDGRANAMLGLLALENGRSREAAAYLADASMTLEAADAREAARYAALARSANYGGSSTRGVFALQAGAFRELDRAQTVADNVQSNVSGRISGPVFIIPRTDGRGQTLHLVQFGAFSTRREADAARSRIGRLEYIVAPIHR